MRFFSAVTNGVGYYSVGKFFSGSARFQIGDKVDEYKVGDKVEIVVDVEDKEVRFLLNQSPVCSQSISWIEPHVKLHLVVFCNPGADVKLRYLKDSILY